MAEITRRRQGEMARAAFEAVLEHANEMAAQDVIRAVEHCINPSPFELSDYPNRPGVRRFDKLVRFATIAPVKAGWLLKSRGTWSVTDEGRTALLQYADPEAFMKEAVRLYRQWLMSQPDLPEAAEDPADDAASATATLEEAEEAAWQEILNYLHVLNPYDFQKLVGVLLEAMGYHVSWIAPPGPDRGIDLVAFTDPLGAQLPRIKVQVKRRADKLGAGELRSFMAVLGDQDVGIVISLGGFTSEAEMESRTQERRRLTLIDADRFFALWIQHYEQIPEVDRHLLPLKPVHYLAPRD